ncbi:MAG: UDP-2,3-diacylglucosamine diphosphatase LpxI [Alphaproteobacteria bacterium]|nr:UDP-2,3-diacylglucosamine diphosphatase LpxI [Alphaproteobacteria bacterium]
MRIKDKNIAIIAGALRLPFLVKDSLINQGYNVFTVGLKNYVDAKLKPDIVVRIGQGGTVMKELKKRGIRQMILVGALGHPKFSDIRPDFWSMKLAARVLSADRGYDSMLTVLVKEIEKFGVKVLAAQDLCPDLVFKPGLQTKTKPGKADKKNIDRAVEVSKIIGQADIGHSVVVDKMVLGVEGADGTAALLERIIKIRDGKKRSGVFAKMTKPGQSLKIELPAIGPDTISNVAKAGLNGIIVNAGSCLVIDLDQVLALANKHKIFIYAV